MTRGSAGGWWFVAVAVGVVLAIVPFFAMVAWIATCGESEHPPAEAAVPAPLPDVPSTVPVRPVFSGRPVPPAPSEVPADSASGHPELYDVEESLVEKIAWGWGEDGPARLVEFHGERDTKSKERVLAVLDQEPRRMALPFVAFLVRRFGAPDKTTYFTPPSSDGESRWCGTWLGAHLTPETAHVIGRAATDRSLDVDLREEFVVALARPGNDEARAALLDVVLDEWDSAHFRAFALRRLPRFGGAAPVELRELLYLPDRGVAAAAAAALARWNDREAPFVLVEGMRADALRGSGLDVAMCAHALRPIVGDDPDLAPRLADAANEHRTYTARDLDLDRGGLTAARAAEGVAFAKLADDVERWLDAHPERCDTEFERGRREYLAGERRRRELAHTSLDVVLAAEGDDFDLAAALIVPMCDRGAARIALEELDRFARLVRREAGPAPAPDAWIVALNRRILRGPRELQDGPDRAELLAVLRSGRGNCLGLSTLYLAVAERLGLPVRGVEAPGHVFLRWDDGVVRRNIEPLDGGGEHDDRWYATRYRDPEVSPQEIEGGAYLASLSKRSLLALALGTRAYMLGNYREGVEDVEEALDCAEWAVRLAPDNAYALVTRAKFSSVRHPDDASPAVEDLRVARSRRRLTGGEAQAAIAVYLAAKLPNEALSVADAAVERDLHALGDPDRPEVRLADVEMRIAAGDASWRARLERRDADVGGQPFVRLDLAEHLLDGVWGRPPAAEVASEVLDGVQGFVTTLSPAASATLVRRYLELRARCCRALGDDAGAAAAEAELAKLAPKAESK